MEEVKEEEREKERRVRAVARERPRKEAGRDETFIYFVIERRG